MLFFRCRSSRTHLPDNTTALIKGNHWLGCFVIQVQALLDGLLVVIRAAAGLTAFQKPLDHRVCFCVDVQQQAGFADLGSKTVCSFKLPPFFFLNHCCKDELSPYLLLKLLPLLHLTGIAINKVTLGDISLGNHGFLNHV